MNIAHRSFSEGQPLPEPLGLQQWRNLWGQTVHERVERSERSDKELDDIEAELYRDIRTRHDWPEDTQDPRPSRWRGIAWEPITSVHQAPNAFVPGRAPWIPLAEDDPE